MKTYLVGGAVRDALMGLPVQDRDWVVVGASPQQLRERAFVLLPLSELAPERVAADEIRNVQAQVVKRL